MTDHPGHLPTHLSHPPELRKAKSEELQQLLNESR